MAKKKSFNFEDEWTIYRHDPNTDVHKFKDESSKLTIKKSGKKWTIEDGKDDLNEWEPIKIALFKQPDGQTYRFFGLVNIVNVTYLLQIRGVEGTMEDGSDDEVVVDLRALGVSDADISPNGSAGGRR